ncbi:MAG: calcium-binding protein [Actinomycetota bacterium]
MARLTAAFAVALLWLGLMVPAALGVPIYHCLGRIATIVGTDGNDRLKGTPGDDVIVGLDGIDHIRGRAGRDRICGGSGREKSYYGIEGDVLRGGEGRDLIRGGPGPDSITGDGGNDVMWGNAGRDDSTGGAGGDVVRGGRGHDSLSEWGGRDHLFGGPGRDRLFGGPGNDRVRGGAGVDTIGSSGGDDLFVGGPGADWVDYCTIVYTHGGVGACGDDAVLVDLRVGVASPLRLGAGAMSIPSGPGEDRLRAIENVYGSYGSDLIFGTSQRNVIIGDSGYDEVRGRGGDDVLLGTATSRMRGRHSLFVGGAGDDELGFGPTMIRGGPGFDTLVSEFGRRENRHALNHYAITADLRRGVATIGRVTSHLESIEGAYGSLRADVLIGDEGKNVLIGGPRDDHLDGGLGRDRLLGDRGSDTCLRGPVLLHCEREPWPNPTAFFEPWSTRLLWRMDAEQSGWPLQNRLSAPYSL